MTRRTTSSMKRAVQVSSLLHVAVFLVAAFGIVPKTPPLDLLPPIDVDLIDPSELTAAPNTRKEAPKPDPKDETPEKAAESNVEDITAPEQITKTPVEEIEELPEPDPVPVVDEKPKEKEKPKPKPEVKKEKPKPKPEPKKDFASVLKNIAQETPIETTPPVPDTAIVDANKPQGLAPTVSETLSISEIDLLRRQLAQCWNIPIGAQSAEDLLVEVRVFLAPDNSVSRAEILNDRSDPFYRAAAESARRAVLNPRCNPLALPQGTATRHRTIVLRFNPQDMF